MEIIYKLNNAQGLYFWGAGRRGKILHRALGESGFKISGLIDSNPNLWGKQVFGTTVISPDEFFKKAGASEYKPQLIITTLYGQDELLKLAQDHEFQVGENLFFYDDFKFNTYVVEVSGCCNLGCLACPQGPSRTQPRPPTGLMSLADFLKVIEKIRAEDPWAKELQLYQWGEPLLNPKLPEMIKAARKLDFEVAISSNLNYGLNLKEVIEAGPTWFRVSVSGAGPDYELTHNGGRWAKVSENLRVLAKLQAESQPDLKIEIFYHLYRHNQGQSWAEVKKLCRELGLDLHPVWAYLISLDEVAGHLEGQPWPQAAQKALDLLVIKPPEVLAQALKEKDEPCQLKSCLMVNWDLSVRVCLVYFYPADNLAAENFLNASLAEINRTRDNSNLCQKCQSRGLHRYCQAYMNWPLEEKSC